MPKVDVVTDLPFSCILSSAKGDVLGGSTVRMPVPRGADLRGTWASAACSPHSSFTFCAETRLKIPLALLALKSVQGNGTLSS